MRNPRMIARAMVMARVRPFAGVNGRGNSTEGRPSPEKSQFGGPPLMVYNEGMTNPDGIFKPGQASMLDSSGRLKELRPAELYRRYLKVKPGLTGVDLGSGTGVFALPLAELAGNGTVYAVDHSDV